MTSETEKTEEVDDLSRINLSIFVDANVLIPMFLRKDDTEFEVLEVLSEAGKARLLTTDVTRIEVAKNLAEKDLEIISPIEKKAFRERVKKMLDISLSNVNMRQLYLQAYQRHMEDIEEKTTGRCWELLTSDGINLPDIFFQYGEKSGLFSGQTKKHQFADAVVFELLKQRALVDFPVLIYSRDNDFEGVSKETENFRYANSLGDLFGRAPSPSGSRSARTWTSRRRTCATMRSARRKTTKRPRNRKARPTKGLGDKA